MDYHTKISYLKSFIRILGYILILISPKLAVIVLLVSELLGIIEEIKWR